jgi:hypothetical protein
MADPVTWLYIGTLVLTAASTAVSIDAQKQQAKTAVRVADYNAEIDEQSAIQADMEAREKATRIRKRNKSVTATQRSKIAAAGILTSGSPLEVLGETEAALELEAMDAARIGRTALSAGFARAEATRFAGASQAASLKTDQTATLLSGLNSATQTGVKAHKAGAFG